VQRDEIYAVRTAWRRFDVLAGAAFRRAVTAWSCWRCSCVAA